MENLYRVLAIENNEQIQASITKTLQEFCAVFKGNNQKVRYQVEIAESGSVGLEKIRQAAPDLLLLDNTLPDMSGLQVLEVLSKLDVDMLTVLVTAQCSMEMQATATDYGAYNFLLKPFSDEQLKQSIRVATHHLMLFRQARKLEEEKWCDRFHLSSVVVHELKAPLAAIEGYLNILKDRTAGDDQQTYERIIDRSLIRLEGIRKLVLDFLDFLDLTRIESGKKRREFHEVNLTEIVRTSVEIVEPDARLREIEITLNAPADLMMQADHSELEIIFNNLISNAVKYNRDHGRVDVTLACVDGVITAEVADTGIGMTPAESAKLFHEFVRIKNQKTTKIAGSGLGLSIVKKLVSLYGGKVSVTSEPDVGSKFTVLLPQHVQS